MLLTRLADLLSGSCTTDPSLGLGVGLCDGEAVNPDVQRACFDSREIMPGDLYCALAGARTHGESFVAQAIRSGASAVLQAAEQPSTSIPTIFAQQPNQLAQIAGAAAAILDGNPCDELSTVAVTGTNGKSTVVHLLEQAWNQIGRPAGRVGTLGFQFEQDQSDSINTTPRADLIQHWLADIQSRGARAAAIEASSHGIHQGRLAGCTFNSVGWTNLSHDHLDYHQNMDAYARAKADLVHALPAKSTAWIPATDSRIQACVQGAACSILTWSLQDPHADLHAVYQPISANEGGGLQLDIKGKWGETQLRSTLLGKHNGENLLLAFGLLCASGLTAEESKFGLESATAAPGRLQRVARQSPWALFVDYAHTPEALQRVLQALRTAYPGRRIGIVCGAGGDRDPRKRAPMGEAAAAGADWCMLTSDNPRTENPELILKEVMVGAQAAKDSGLCAADCQIYTQVDRRLAIQKAVAHLETGDVLLVAGKGHEPYQEINGVRHSFDDRIELQEAVRCCS